MKTIKILSALTFVMLIVLFNTFSAKSTGNSIEVPVTYVVTVDNHVNLKGGIYYVNVLNDRGSPVAQEQLLKKGISTYIFVEYGPIQGNRRIAAVRTAPHAFSDTFVVFDPVNLMGPFILGKTYFFPLLTPQRQSERKMQAALVQ